MMKNPVMEEAEEAATNNNTRHCHCDDAKEDELNTHSHGGLS